MSERDTRRKIKEAFVEANKHLTPEIQEQKGPFVVVCPEHPYSKKFGSSWDNLLGARCEAKTSTWDQCTGCGATAEHLPTQRHKLVLRQHICGEGVVLHHEKLCGTPMRPQIKNHT